MSRKKPDPTRPPADVLDRAFDEALGLAPSADAPIAEVDAAVTVARLELRQSWIPSALMAGGRLVAHLPRGSSVDLTPAQMVSLVAGRDLDGPALSVEETSKLLGIKP